MEASVRRVTIPEGFAEVTEGRVKRSDLVWNPLDETWDHPKAAPYKSLGNADGWWCVVRKVS